MTTRSNCLSSESKGLRREGSASRFFLLILVPISPLQRGCFVGEEGLFSSRIIETKTGRRLLGYAQEPRHDDLQEASHCDEGWLDLDSAARLPVNRSFMRSLT